MTKLPTVSDSLFVVAIELELLALLDSNSVFVNNVLARAFPIIYQENRLEEAKMGFAMYVPVKGDPKDGPADDPINSRFTIIGDDVLGPGGPLVETYDFAEG